MNERVLRILAPAGVLALGIVLWDLVVRINGIPPYSKIGGVLYFDYDDILKVMEERKINHGHSARQ